MAKVYEEVLEALHKILLGNESSKDQHSQVEASLMIHEGHLQRLNIKFSKFLS